MNVDNEGADECARSENDRRSLRRFVLLDSLRVRFKREKGGVELF